MSSGQHKIKTLLSLAALLAASAAMAVVNNLESYHLRHGFSTGSRVALLGPQCTADFIENKGETAAAGPNGAANAVHPTYGNWGAVTWNGSAVANTYLATHDWTVALCLHPGNDEKGVLFAVGRQNTSNGRSAISLCSSSDPTKLYLYDTRKSGSAAVETGHETITGLANMTNGFHTVVMSYAKASSNLTVYVDGVKKVTHKVGGGTKSYYVGEGLEYCQTMSYMPGALSTTWGNPDVSFYDMRFYFGAFSDADAEAYAALYPADRMGSPFRPSAYIESGATNTTANATVGSYIDTGYFAQGATTRIMADYQFLDLRGQQRIFGARCTDFTQGLYINGSAASGGKLAWNFMTTASWVSMGVDAVRSRQIAVFDRVGKTIAVTNYANRAQFYSNASHAELIKATGDATSTTYLFAENNSGAKNYGKARIYSFEADESGTPALFLAPDIENGEAGFRNIIDGSFHGDGNKNNNPERTLRFYDGVGRASDYKYENGTLYAKLYATSDAYGAVSVAGGAAVTSADGWVPRGGTLALTAVTSDPNRYEFCSWTGDTWAIADGYSVSNASIEVSTPYAVQLRATFKLVVNAQLAIAADGADAVNWSAADWRDSDDSSVPISVPVDKEVTVVAHKSVTLTLDADVSLSKFIVQADDNCVVTFASNGSRTFHANEVVVSNGVLQQGSATVFGTTPKVTVEDGGTFDSNALNVNGATSFYLAGAGAGDWPWALTCTGGVPGEYFHNFVLTKNATIGSAENSQLKVGYASGSSSRGSLALDGHTLTVAGGMWFTFRRLKTPGTGTILYNGRGAAFYESAINTEEGNTTFVLGDGITESVNVNNPVTIHALEWRGRTLDTSSAALTVKSSLMGYGTTAKLSFNDGATAVLEGNLTVTNAMTAAGALSLTRAAGVETNVTVAATGTLTASGAISVGAGVVFDIGANRPTGTFTVDDGATLALRKVNELEEDIVLNATAQPRNIVVYDTNGAEARHLIVNYADGTLTIRVVLPHWTNSDGTGSLDSRENWSCMPAAGDDVFFDLAGDVAVTSSVWRTFGKMLVNGAYSVDFTEAKLQFTAIDIPASCTVALATLDGIAEGGVTGTGTLSLAPGEVASVAIGGLSSFAGDFSVTPRCSMTGTLTCAATSLKKFTLNGTTNVVFTLVKGTGGSFTANEAVVAGGVLRQGSANVLGDTPKITVQDGGTFDINAKTIRQETPIYIAGAGAGDWPWALASSSGAMASNNYLFDLHLTADATVGAGQFKLGRSDVISFIYLNNHTLTAKSWMTLRNINTLKGTLDLQAGATFNATDNINRLDAYRGTTLIVHEGFTYNNQTDREVDVSYLKMYGGAIGYGSTARDFGVWNELHGYGVVKRLVMGPGAEYYPDGEHYLNVTESLSGKLKVDISDPALAGMTRIPLLKVPTALKDTADNAFDLSDVSRWGWTLSGTEEGGTNAYDLVMSAVPTLEANGSVTWSTGTWTADGRTVPAPASGPAGVNVTGTTTLTLDGTASMDTLIVNGGSGAKLTLVTAADATFNIDRIVLNGSVTLENLSDGSGGGSVVSGSGPNGLVVDLASMLFEGEGRIDVYSALSFNQRNSSASECVVTVLDGGALNQDAGGFTAVKSLIFESGASFWARAATGHPTTIVFDTYAPNMIHTGSELTGPIVQLGDAQHLTPTLDLSRFCTNGVDVVFAAEKTTFQPGTTVSVKLGDRTIGDQDGKKVASWSVRPQGVKFVCGDEGRNCMFAAEADGLYIYRGFSIFLY